MTTRRWPVVCGVVVALAWPALTGRLVAQQRPVNYPTPVQGDFVIKNFHFRSGETLPEVKMHYRALGTLQKNAQGVVQNAVLVMHGTGGSGGSFLSPIFAGELFGPGQLLDATKYFIVLPDDIGHGASTKPSDGLHAKFPKYGYLDMVEAEYRLLSDGLGVNHLRLVMGTSMGGMHTWLWGEEHPDMMDALMPLASVPTQISGRNRAWRRVVIDAITNDPEWKGGEYTTQPAGLRIAAQMTWLVSDNPLRRYNASPTLAKADQTLDASVATYVRQNDANNVLYAYRASEDYDPGPKLEQIKAPLFAVNSADDLVNPPEIGVLEREIKRVPKGRAIMIELSEKTAGHGTHTMAAVWKQYLEELLKISRAKAIRLSMPQDSPGRSAYRFVTDWSFDAPIDAVWAEINQPDAWPSWWRGVVSVELLEPGDAAGVGSYRRMTWKSLLPYKLQFNMRTLKVQRPATIEGIADGELCGEGRWTLTPTPSGTHVRYDWTVEATKPWMRLLGPIAKPIFEWNHDIIMRWGYEGLQRRLRGR